MFDYKAALEDISKHDGKTFSSIDSACLMAGNVLMRHHDTIRQALKIAEKVMEGPDMNAVGEAMRAWDIQMKDKDKRSWPVMMITVFKAMRDQMLKEVG